MKAFKILVGALLVISVSAYAADNKQSANAPLIKKNQQSQTAKPKNSNYTWQDCVNDMEKEGGHSQEEAYKLCQDMQ
jgi:hypothetical protein